MKTKKEIVNSFELIKEDVEIYVDYDSPDGDFYDVYLDSGYNSDNSMREEVFYAVSTQRDEVLVYKPTDTLDNIAKKHKHSILEYCLGKNYRSDDEVGAGDIFLHGEFINRCF